MRTKLFHTIVLCGAAMGAVACSDDGGDSEQNQQQVGHGGSCAAGVAVPIPAGGAGDEAGSGGAVGSTMTPCGGWPTTK